MKVFQKYNFLYEIYKWLVIFGYIKLVWCTSFNQYVQSPCPSIFRYHTDESGILYGTIEVVPPQDNNSLQLVVELSVGNSVNGFQGALDLVLNKNKVAEDIKYGKTVMYRVQFPYWSGQPPRVTKITVNGQTICAGSKISLNEVRVLTTIVLQHTLKLTGVGGSNPELVNSAGEGMIDPRIYGLSNTQLNGLSIHNLKNKYNFNPVTPKNELPTEHNTNVQNNNPVNMQETFPSNFWNEGNSYAQNPFLNGNINVFNQPDNSYGQKSYDNGNSNSFNGREKPNNNRPNSDNSNIQKVLPTSINPPVITTEAAKSKFGVDFPPENDFDQSPIPETETLMQLPYREICGISTATRHLIVNGDTVPAGVYPWLVAIYEVKASGLSYTCCGMLVSNRHVVTAAHCMMTPRKRYRPYELLLRLGKLNIADWNVNKDEVMSVPKSIDVHPDYKYGNSDADIAILTLNEVTFSTLIRPICLWSGPSRLDLIVGNEGTVVGWGKDQTGAKNTALPKQLTMPIVSQEECLRSSYEFRDITSNRTFCAGKRDDSGPCTGDSGSGLIIKKNGRWVLRGIVSMSLYDQEKYSCDLKKYIVFTDSSKFSDWLMKFVN